jgi:acetolactate decarboxylase
MSAAEANTVFMVSPINAILEGLYQTNTTMADLKRQGDFGLGTFNDLDGELILLDGVAYQLNADGIASIAPDTVRTPFATACRFTPFSVEPITKPLAFNEFETFLNDCLPSLNMLYAIRVDGEFQSVRSRSVPRTRNYTPLVDATAHQKESHFAQVEGTLVGFYTPSFMPSVNVPGYHFHFITGDRTRGGHLLACNVSRGQLSIQVCSRLSLNLPVTLDYLTAEFSRDPRKDIEKAER